MRGARQVTDHRRPVQPDRTVEYRYLRLQARGRPNTSGTATLQWRIADDIVPFAVTVRIEAPGQYGHSHIQTVDVTIEIVSKLSAWMATGHSPLLPSPGGVRWLGPSEWTALLDAIIATLTAQAITTSLADLADVDAFLIPPPRTIHVVSDKEIAGFPTPYLRPVPCVQSAPLDGDGAGRAG